MQPILLATDGSPSAANAAARAIDLAQALGAPLLIASIWELESAPMGYGLGMAPGIPDLDVGREMAETVVHEAADLAREAGIEAETVVRRGVATQGICELAEEWNVRLVVVGSHGWGPIRRMVFGSVSTGVLHHSRRPVLVVPAAHATEHADDGAMRTEVEV